MAKYKNKLERQRNSRTRLRESIFRTYKEISGLEKEDGSHVCALDQDKLDVLHYKLAQNLKEFITVDERIKEEEAINQQILANFGKKTNSAGAL